MKVTKLPLDVVEHLRGLLGRVVPTVTRGQSNSILALDEENVIVGTERSPDGRPIPLADIRAGLDKLVEKGELRVSVDELGHRSSAVAAILATVPGVAVLHSPTRLRLRGKARDVTEERERRRKLWDALDPQGPDRAEAAASLVRSLRIYNTQRGIFADLKVTRETTEDPRGATVAVRHTGRSYADDLSPQGIRYHYPQTRVPTSDATEVAATKAAAELGLPVFVILEGTAGSAQRIVRPAWVMGWSDEEALFELHFGSLNAPVPSSSVSVAPMAAPTLEHFRPKDASDYRAHVNKHELVKTRRHEGLIRDYGVWAEGRGFQPSTAEHPKDLVLRRDGKEWLVEGKVVRKGNATAAVREALAQLLEYDHFLAHRTKPRLVALFTAPVGGLYVAFLQGFGIQSVWAEDGGWFGTQGALADDLVDHRGTG